MQQTIDDIFERIKIPESGLALSQSNIVEKIRYVKSKGKLIVVRYPIRSSEGCCTLITDAMLGSIFKELRFELGIAFPDLTIEII